MYCILYACTGTCICICTRSFLVQFVNSILALCILAYIYVMALCVLFVWVAFLLSCKLVCYIYTCTYISMYVHVYIVPILSPGARGRC